MTHHLISGCSTMAYRYCPSPRLLTGYYVGLAPILVSLYVYTCTIIALVYCTAIPQILACLMDISPILGYCQTWSQSWSTMWVWPQSSSLCMFIPTTLVYSTDIPQILVYLMGISPDFGYCPDFVIILVYYMGLSSILVSCKYIPTILVYCTGKTPILVNVISNPRLCNLQSSSM